jgi:hypothetical protein
MANDHGSEFVEDSDSAADGPTSTCEPGTHRWQMMSVTEGEIWGVDGLGRPVFVPSATEPEATAFGCGLCGVAWHESLSESLS